jgi:hypothetical protein
MSKHRERCGPLSDQKGLKARSGLPGTSHQVAPLTQDSLVVAQN